MTAIFPRAELDPFAEADLAIHAAATTDVHGIADTAQLATLTDVADLEAALAAHSADTTGVHGIADTALLVLDDDTRLTDARPPTAHGHVIGDVAGLQAVLDAKTDPAFVNQTAAGLVTLTPDTAARNTIQPTLDVVPLTVKGRAAGVANVFESQTSAGTVLVSHTSVGRVGIGTAVPTNTLDIQASSGAGVVASVLNSSTVGRAELWLNASTTRWTVMNNGSPNWQFLVMDSQNNATKMTMSRGGAGAVVLQPNSGNVAIGGSGPNARLHVTGETTTLPVVIAKGVASQTGDLFQAQDSAASVRAYINSAGYGNFLRFQVGGGAPSTTTALLVTGNGTTDVPVTAKLYANATGDAVQVQDSTGAVLGRIDSVGGFRGPFATFTPSAVGNSAMGALFAGDGYSRFIMMGDGAMSWGTGAATRDVQLSRTAAGALTQQGIGGATATQSITKMVAAQSLDPVQVQSSSGAVLARIDSAGRIGIGIAPTFPLHVSSAGHTRVRVEATTTAFIGGLSLGAAGGTTWTIDNRNSFDAPNNRLAFASGAIEAGSVSSAGQWLFGGIGQATTTVPVVVKAVASQATDLQQWQNAAGAVGAAVGSGGDSVRSRYFHDTTLTGPYIDTGVPASGTTLTVIPRSATQVPWTIKGAASQTGDLDQRQDSAGAVLSRFNAAGQLGIKAAAAAPGALAGYGFIYVNATGALRYRGPTTDTQLAVA